MVYRRLFGYVRPAIFSMFVGLVLTGLASVAVLGYAKAAQTLVQAVVTHNLRILWLALLGALALNVIKNGAQYAGGYTLVSVGQQVVARVRHDLFARIQYLPLQIFDAWRSGDFMSRFANDIALMTVGVSQLPLFCSAAITLVGAVAVMFYIDWRLTLITIALAPLVSYAVLRFSMLLRRLTTHSLLRVADLNSMLQEALESMRIIKAFGREPYEIRRFDNSNEAYLGASMKLAQISLTQTPIVDFIVTVGLLALAGYSFYELATGKLQPGSFAAFFTLAIVASNPINQITNYFGDLNKAYSGAVRIFEVLDLPVEVRDAPNARALTDVRGAVEFADVHFAYDGVHEVLNSVSARVEPGAIIALVGPTGVGKTTLVNLIPRFYVPTSGAVRIDGFDTREVTLSSLRAAIAIVPQDPQLFSLSIEDNIRYGRLGATDAEIKQAARLANAHEFVENFPDGYATVVGARGMRLSGGERQRIAIARAILRDPRILILDEATSALDAQSEALVNEALDHLLVGRTTFIIAHRLSTIRRATNILVMKDGRIVERGTHADLLEAGGVYAMLYETQILRPTASAS